MDELTTIYLCLGISLILLSIKLITGGLKDLLTPLCLFYFYFTFGPVINYLVGSNIYFGVPQEYIPEACIIFTVALATMIIGSFIWRAKDLSNFSPQVIGLIALKPVFFISVLYSLFVITRIFFGDASTKIDKIALAVPTFHYSYLMIQIYLTSFYFLIQETSLKKFYYFNVATYIAYSLVVGERDFIFPIMSIIFHRFLFQNKGLKQNLMLIASTFTMMGVATAIFFIRDASQSSQGALAAILNQGSLLFVNTFSLKLLHERVDYFFGYTYLNSILNLLPGWIYKTDFNTLDWFKNSYSEASTSGYGFGLDAEGYINFSYFGVFLTFFTILFIQRKIAKHITNHPFFIYYSVFFSAFTMYSIRNDSLAFIKGNLYGIIFFFLIYKFSWDRKSQ